MAGTSYVLRNKHGRYLEYLPHQEAWEWLASDERHATPLSEEAATEMVRAFDSDDVTMHPDYYCRRPVDHE